MASKIESCIVLQRLAVSGHPNENHDIHAMFDILKSQRMLF